MVYTPKVKICGITNAEDAAVAVAAGADALGFVLYRKSPRYIEPTLVRQIIMSLPPLVTPVGVFVDEEQLVVRNLMDDCGLALAQLHSSRIWWGSHKARTPRITAIARTVIDAGRRHVRMDRAGNQKLAYRSDSQGNASA